MSTPPRKTGTPALSRVRETGQAEDTGGTPMPPGGAPTETRTEARADTRSDIVRLRDALNTCERLERRGRTLPAYVLERRGQLVADFARRMEALERGCQSMDRAFKGSTRRAALAKGGGA